MAANSSIVLEGTLNADGTLELVRPPELPPGPVRVTLEFQAERLPEPPWPDESISVPFDLPRSLQVEPVQPRQASERLPEPFDWSDERSA